MAQKTRLYPLPVTTTLAGSAMKTEPATETENSVLSNSSAVVPVSQAAIGDEVASVPKSVLTPTGTANAAGAVSTGGPRLGDELTAPDAAATNQGPGVQSVAPNSTGDNSTSSDHEHSGEDGELDDDDSTNDAPAEDLGGLSEAEHEHLYGRHERGSPRGCFGEEPFATWNRARSGYDEPDQSDS
jgi:hypothetical protein